MGLEINVYNYFKTIIDRYMSLGNSYKRKEVDK